MSTAVEGGTEALPPGTITITAETMTMSGRTQIFAFTTSPAPAGNIALNVNTLRSNVNPDGTLINDGQPRSLLASVGVGEDSVSGRGGTVTISGLAPGNTDPAKLIALHNIRTPVKIALLTLFVTQMLNLALIGWLKHAGLALSIGLAASLNAGLLYHGLRGRGIYTPQPGWWWFYLKLAFAMLSMGTVLWYLRGDAADWLGWRLGERWCPSHRT